MHPHLDMATLTVKNLPDEVYAALTKLAKQNRRSINSEAIVQLEKIRLRTLRDVEAELKQIKKLRESLKSVKITEEDLNLAKNEGRP